MAKIIDKAEMLYFGDKNTLVINTNRQNFVQLPKVNRNKPYNTQKDIEKLEVFKTLKSVDKLINSIVTYHVYKGKIKDKKQGKRRFW